MALANIVRNNHDDVVISAADDFNLNKKGGSTHLWWRRSYSVRSNFSQKKLIKIGCIAVCETYSLYDLSTPQAKTNRQHVTSHASKKNSWYLQCE